MPEIIGSIILVLSALGLGYMLAKKVPVLLTFPAKDPGSSPREMMEKLKASLRDSKTLRQVVSPEILLQTMLSKTRIVALKTESKTGQILESLRKKSQEKNGDSKFSDDYWKKLRKKKV